MKEKELIKAALAARENAYCHYSGFYVGAALLTKDGKIYSGCNVENGVFSASVCAERTAFYVAVAQGERAFQAIAIAADETDYCYPCGICRQVMAEFCGEDFLIYAVKNEADYKIFTLAQLLPQAFHFGKA
ncbi:MAG TPA: cytidine deaminase [Clostridiales bacterium]|nr:cytidine deaminase [Clostridiales bacterium]